MGCLILDNLMSVRVLVKIGVLYGPKGFLAIEIKKTARFSTKDFKGLQAFGKDYPEAKLYFLYGGMQIEYHGNITVVPFLNFLAKILDFC